MWMRYDRRHWFGAAARVSDADLRDLELRALRTDAAAARAAEEAIGRRSSWRRNIRHAVRRMLRTPRKR
jgi:hypothetical protein